MTKETPIINILTYHLPYDLTNQIYNEFQNRFNEATFLINKYKSYKVLQDDFKTVELLLSLSIFHKRVIASLDAAVQFHKTVITKSQADTIGIGSYDLTVFEKNKLLAVTMSYNQLIQNFSIPSILMEYAETKEFLKCLISLKSNLKNAETKDKTNTISKRQEDNQNDLTF